jgi:hypothetical protein
MKTSVPAQAMMSVEDCWSRRLTRFALVANGPLAIDKTTKRIPNGIRIPDRRKSLSLLIARQSS